MEPTFSEMVCQPLVRRWREWPETSPTGPRRWDFRNRHLIDGLFKWRVFSSPRPTENSNMPRRHERSGIRKEISLTSASGRRETRISDLSLGGCYVESISIYSSGEEVEFDLQDDAGQTLHFTGTIAYVLEGQGFGLNFTNLTPDHLAFLESELTADSEAFI
jgi:hypothetical protein